MNLNKKVINQHSRIWFILLISFLYLPLKGQTINVTADSVTCNGADDGQIHAEVSGGVANYTYILRRGGAFFGTNYDTIGPTASTNVTFTDLDPDNWGVVVIDGNSNQAGDSENLYEPEALTADHSSSDITCNGADDGTITISNPAGGSGNYEYTINGGGSWQSSGSYTNLTSGTYDVRMRDASHPTCELNINNSLDINEPAVLSANLNSTNITCNGADNGTITISSPAGGSGNYEYTINGGGSWESSGSYTNLTPGTYDVRMRDANNPTCVLNLDNSLTLTEPTALSADHDSTNITCFGDDDGTITITNPAGGSGNYEYTINGGTSWESSGNYTNLEPGTYDVRMRDANTPSCELVLDNNLVLNEPAELVPSNPTVHKALTCFDASDAELRANWTGGTPPFTFTWRRGGVVIPGATDSILTNVDQQTYVYSMVDGNGCTTGSTYSIFFRNTNPLPQVSDSIPDEIMVGSIAGTQTVCDGEDPANLTSSADPTGGSGGWTYQWQSDAGCTGTWSNIGGATSNEYDPPVLAQTTCFRRIDINANCGQDTTNTVTVTVNPLPTSNDQTPSACSDAAEGNTATVDLTTLENAIDGGNGYTHTWYSDAGLTTPIADPTNYTVTDATPVYDEVDDGTCQDIATITYTVNPTPTANDQTPTICSDAPEGNTATVDLTTLENAIDGGNGYTINWFSDAGLTTPIGDPTNYVVSDGVPVYAQTANGPCSNTATITYTVTATPTANDQTPSACSDGQEGNTATVDLTTLNNSVNGGNGYTVNWYTDAGLTNPIGDPTNYTVTDATPVYAETVNNGCTNSATITYTVNPTPTANDLTPTECSDAPEGNTATVNLTSLENIIDGGNSYTINWYSDAGLTTPIGDPTNYTVTDAIPVYAEVINGPCNNIATITYSVDPTPTANDQTPTVCSDGEEGNTATVDLTTLENSIDGGNGYTVNWYSDAGLTTPIGDPTNYTVTDGVPVYAETQNGVCFNSATVTYTVNPTPTANDQTPTVCSDGEEGNTATVDLTTLENSIDGGNGYTVNWYSDAGLTTAIGDPTNYTVTDGVPVYAETENNGCTNSASVTYTVNPTPTANDQTPTVCSDGVEGNTATVDLTTLENAIDGGNGYTINWYSDAGLTTAIGTPASYVVSDGTPVYAEVINGPCSNVATITYTVNPTPTANDQTPTACSDGEEGNTATVDLTTLNNSIDGGNGYTVNWYSDAGLTTPIADPTNYTVTDATPVYAETVNNGCTNSATITYTVNPTPTANDQTPTVCSDGEEGNTATVDLTTLENSIDGGNGYTINWYSDAGLTNPIGTPVSYTVTDATPVYAEVVNGPCNNIATVTYTVNPTPTANDQTPTACSDGVEGNTATVDLTTLENSIDGGNGYTINWYSDAGLTTPIGDPTNYTVTDATPVYAEVINGSCSNSATITYTVNPTPTANDQTPTTCSDIEEGNTATVDLTTLENSIDGGNGYTVNWYSDASLTTPIADPTNYTVTDATPVYAETVNNGCSNSATITYTVNPTPTANDQTPAVCSDGVEGNTATVDLTTLENSIDGGNGYTINWYSDAGLTNPIGTPASYTVTDATPVYAEVVNGPCSNVANITYTVNPTPTANDQTPSVCSDAEEGNTAAVNLTALDFLVNGGNGYTVNWYSDAGLTTPIATPTNYTVTDGVPVYAETVNGPCTNSATITYTVNPTPTANDQTPTVCSDGEEGNTATVDLTTLENSIDGGNGYTINWYSDAGLTTPIGDPTNYTITDATPVYAEVVNGPCSNVATINYTVNPTPTANDQSPTVCSDGVEGNSATVDLTTLENSIDGGNGYTINWYSDAGLTTPIGDPTNYTVTDATPVYAEVVNGPCSNMATITYTVNPTPTANDQTPATCSDTEEGNTATVDLTTLENAIDGGNGYTINWYSDAGLTAPIGDPTNYTVTDATPIYAEVVNGPCSNVATITYTVNPLPTANDQTPMACSDAPEGNTATVDLTTLENAIDGGNGYTITWYSDAGLTTAIGDPTNYTVTDATPVYAEVVNGSCSNVATATYSITATPTANDQTPEACSDAPGGNTATVDLTTLNNAIDGGNGYTVNWYSDAGLTNPIADPTNYTVTDATPVYAETVNGTCTNSATITYTVNPSPDANVSPDPAEACVGVDLVLNGNPSGGSGIYTHTWTGSAVGSLSDPNIVNPTFNNNTAGSYNLTYTVTDDNGCIGSDDITVDVESLPTIDAGPNDTICYDETIYDIMGASASNQSAIEWTFSGNGSFDPIISQPTENAIDPTYYIDPSDKDRTNISDVTLYMEAWGVNGCSSESIVDSFTLSIAPELQVSVGAPSPFTIDASTTDIEVSVNISGRNTISDLSILLISPNDSVVPLTITDADDDGFCNFNDSIGVTFTNNPTPPSIINYCTGADITGNFDIVGDWGTLTGEDPANGLWRIMLVDSIDFPSAGGFDGEVVDASIVFSDTNSLGEYTTLQYKLDGTLDINNAPAYLEGGNTFVDMSLGLRTECYNSCDALAVVTITGGLPPYNINWSHNGSDSDSLLLCPGTYTIDVTDRLGCIDSTTVEVNTPDTIEYTNVSFNDSLYCAGDTTFLTVELAGGTGLLEWTIDGSTYYASGDTLFNLPGGNSTIQVRDANNCTPGDSTIFVYEPNAITIDSIQTSNISCFNAADGSIEVFATGGTDSLMYWIPDVDTVYSSTGSGLFTNLAADTFNIYVTDIYNCGPDSITDVILTQPDTFAIDSLAQIPMVCFGDVAEIGLSVTGGTPNYTYTIDTANIPYSPFAGVDTTWFTIDSTHTFRVYVRDANGCLAISDTINTVAPASVITIDSLGVEPVVGCFGDDSGSIYLRPQGGVAPYQYRLNDTGSYGAFSDTVFFNNLPAGRDTLWVRDTLGCEVMLVDTLITQPQELFLNSITYFGVSCNNGDDGRITATVAGGTALYTFWVDGPVQDTIIQSGTSVEFDSLTPGTYDFYVTDTFACKTETDSDVIGNPPAFEFDTVVVDSFLCFGNPATIAVKVKGGNAPYEYSIDGTSYNAFNDGDSTNISIASSDTVALWARDNNGCEIFYDSIVLIAPTQNITYDSLRVEPVTGCNDDTNGEIYVNAIGGVAPYEYKLGINGAYQDTGLFQNLSIGRDTLFIRDSYGCEVQLLDTLVSGPDSLYIPKERSVIDPFCNNLDTGFVKIFFAGGTKPYEYWIEGQMDTITLPANSDSIQFPLGVGTHNIHGRDANRCKTLDFVPVTITEAQQIQFADTVIQDFTCYNDTAHVTVVLSGGTLPYSYSINGNPGASVNNDTITIDFLPTDGGGTKNIVFSDNDPDNFCDDTLVVNLNNLLPLTIDSVDVNNIACYGESNGEIFIRAIGGQAPYEYKLGEAGIYQSSGLFTGLSPVTDTSIWVRDNLGCEAILTDTFDIIQPDSIYVVDSIIYAVDSDSGGVHLEVFGGEPRFDYEISSVGGSYTDKILNKLERQHTFDSLPLGDYVYTVTDNNGCSYSDTITISSVPPLDVEFALYLENTNTPADSTRCWNTGLDLEVVVNELPGINDDFEVLIYYDTTTANPPVELTELFNNNYFIGGLGEGLNYKVEVNGLNTSRTWDTAFAVYSPPQMFITTTVDSATCESSLSNDGSLEVESVTGGNGGPYNYNWSVINVGNVSQVENLAPGSYSVTVTDRKNCSVSALRRVGYDYGYTVGIISPMPPAICDESEGVNLAASANFNPNRSQTNISYSWSPADLVEDPTAALTGFDIDETTEFTVTTSINGTCEKSASLLVELIEVPELTITPEKNGSFEETDTVGVIENGEVLLSAQPFTYDSYRWSSNEVEALAWIDDMEAQSVYIRPDLRPNEVVLYTLETEYRGCVENDSIWLTFVEELESLPTGFSPNNDGINDRWYIDNASQYGQVDLIVFNRWGEKIYEFSGIYDNTEGWDGTFKGKDLPVGTYFYILRLKDQGGRTIKGTVTIVR